MKITCVDLGENLTPPSLAKLVQSVDPPGQEWFVFLPGGARLHPDFDRILSESVGSRPDVGIFYFDEVSHRRTGTIEQLRKPSLNKVLLWSTDYVGFALALRTDVLRKLGASDDQTDSAWLYQMLLRCVDQGVGVEHIPELLMSHDGVAPRADPASRRRVVAAYLQGEYRNYKVLDGRTPTSTQVRRVFARHPAVTLVVPTMQSRPAGARHETPHIRRFLESLTCSTWPMDRLEVVVGDDEPSADEYVGNWPFRLRRVVTTRPVSEPFNYSRKMNQLWRLAETEHVVLMNDDVVVTSAGWLEALMTFAEDNDVGGVGARLLFPDGSIQHAGVIGGLCGVVAHGWLGEPADRPTYGDWAELQREWSVVTAAVFATRTSVLRTINGFDERFRLEFNDVDLCLRLRALGYRIVYTPFAELVHHEKASRGASLPPGQDLALFLNKWSPWLKDDPAYSPGMRTDGFVPRPKELKEDWIRRC